MQGWWFASYLVLWILVITLCVVVVALARQIGTLHLRLGPRGALELDEEGPPLGEAVESTNATALDGTGVVIGGPSRGQVLLFVSPGCRMCEEVLPSLPVVARHGDLEPYVISDADHHDTAVAFNGKRLNAPVIAAPELAQAYGIPGTPYAVLLDHMGVVRAKGTVNNLEQMEGLLDTALKRSTSDPHERQAS